MAFRRQVRVQEVLAELGVARRSRLKEEEKKLVSAHGAEDAGAERDEGGIRH
ncbi:hypothetical protein [Pseudomonas fluorescens]|jgi:hypothetical protein|uniref:hypothetical protein n=1 Tax=Pseudomonas fluorescens TaxID=294 RepID=UPI0020C4571D|nr:hypothetical protein [Pseudomonas fluorescens]UTL93211.1 hypothetical protein NLL86_10910 [Pseudomonas fluorescens]